MHQTITNNTYHAYLSFTPYHAPYDKDRLQTLTTSMISNGWQGAPLVKFDDQLLTGSHRYQAAINAGMATIPVVDYKDIFCVDEDEVDEIVRTSDVWQVEITYMAIDSDPEIARELGMDIH